jgi:hypothetical protein
MESEIIESFEKGDVPEVIRLMGKYFDDDIYSLWHLFKDEQRKVLDQILQLTYEGVESSYRQIYENNSAIMNFYHSLQQRLPRPFLSAAEYIINSDFKKSFENGLEVEKLNRLIEESKRWSIKLDTTTIGFIASTWVNSIMEKLYEDPEDLKLIENLDDVLEALTPLHFSLDLWKAQNIYFSIGRNFFKTMKKKAARKNDIAGNWIDRFLNLGKHLHVKI